MKAIGFIFLAIGIISIAIQNIFYGYIDANGVLHDSIFLPLGTFATIIGVILLLMAGARSLIRRRNKTNS